ncbi:hypothetical protein GCM10023210_12910 [Chryseobacterium ginsengisoli]|uniref:Uncharacterized protein n=1 Tax=Chryseobacterium ginsengisoli TaxID=363853 RepID=A0ABP9M2U6_9FLAO
MKKKVNFNGKRVLLFSFLLFSAIFYGQTFIRSSDEKVFNNVIVKQDGKNIEINKTNFKDFLFKPDDKIVYDNRLLDFSINQDSLYFFDKVKEIEEINIVGENLGNKNEKIIKSGETQKVYADIFPNNYIATFIKIGAKKRTFVKSITFFPDKRFSIKNLSGKIQIQIMPNLGGFPDEDSTILTFEKDMSETYQNKWEIELPRIMKYPDNGFFVVFYYQSNNKKMTATLKLNNESDMFLFYPTNKEWKSIKNNGYLYKLKILQ